MDGFTLLAHCIWATVVTGLVGTVIYFLRADSFKEEWALRVKIVESAIGNLRSRADDSSKEIAQIREGLEKLKAIPPRQLRL